MRYRAIKVTVLCLFLLPFGYTTNPLTTIADSDTYVEQTMLGRGRVQVVSYRPNFQEITVAGSGGIWHYTDTFENPTYQDIGFVSAIAWSPDGHLLASATQNILRIWNATTEKYILNDYETATRIEILEWSSDNTHLAILLSDDTLSIYDVSENAITATWSSEFDTHISIAWGSDGSQIAVAGNQYDDADSLLGSKIVIWDITTGAIEDAINLDREIVTFTWHPTMSDVFVLSTVNPELQLPDVFEVWNIADSEPLKTFDSWYPALRMKWSPDGQLLAIMDGPGVIILDYEMLEAAHYFTDADTGAWLNSISWSDDSSRIIAGRYDSDIYMWDVMTGELVMTYQGHTEWVFFIDWSPDGEQLVSSGDTVDFWDVESGERRVTHFPDWYAGNTLREFTHAAWHPDGSQIAFTSYGDRLWFWDLSNEQPMEESPEFRAVGYFGRSTLVWSPDGQLLASGSLVDGSITLWSAETHEVIDSFEIPHPTQVLDWSHDGTLLAAGGEAGELSVINFETQAVSSTLPICTQRIIDAEFSPDDQYLAACSDDNSVTIWDIESGEAKLVLEGQTDEVETISWHPDGLRLATGGADDTVRIWDTTTGQTLEILDQRTVTGITDVKWSPDGSLLATSSYDGIIRVWGRE